MLRTFRVDVRPQPAVNPWVVTCSVMLVTFMGVLDTTVVNVSVPHIAGNLATTNEEGTWVVTSYLVSNAIVLPISGWLANHMGRKRPLLRLPAISECAAPYPRATEVVRTHGGATS